MIGKTEYKRNETSIIQNLLRDDVVILKQRDIPAFSEGIGVFVDENNKKGFIKTNGEELEIGRFDYATLFQKDIACVRKQGQTYLTLINKEGEKIFEIASNDAIINMRYKDLFPVKFIDKFALIRLVQDNLGNYMLEEILPSKYDYIGIDNNGQVHISMLIRNGYKYELRGIAFNYEELNENKDLIKVIDSKFKKLDDSLRYYALYNSLKPSMSQIIEDGNKIVMSRWSYDLSDFEPDFCYQKKR